MITDADHQIATACTGTCLAGDPENCCPRCGRRMAMQTSDLACRVDFGCGCTRVSVDMFDMRMSSAETAVRIALFAAWGERGLDAHEKLRGRL